jgi:serine/threonine protein kinase
VKEHCEVSPAADMWAVGIIVYFALIAKYPWQKASVDVKPYFEWEQWMKKKSTTMPPKWGRFTDKGLKIFRKTLRPRVDDRISAKDLRKYVTADKWLRVDIKVRRWDERVFAKTSCVFFKIFVSEHLST